MNIHPGVIACFARFCATKRYSYRPYIYVRQQHVRVAALVHRAGDARVVHFVETLHGLVAVVLSALQQVVHGQRCDDINYCDGRTVAVHDLLKGREYNRNKAMEGFDEVNDPRTRAATRTCCCAPPWWASCAAGRRCRRS